MRFLADENLNNHIYRSLLLQRPDLDMVRVQDVGLYGKSDPEVLAWALLENRILITHDVRTIPALALEWLDAPIGTFQVFYWLSNLLQSGKSLLIYCSSWMPASNRNGMGKSTICRCDLPIFSLGFSYRRVTLTGLNSSFTIRVSSLQLSSSLMSAPPVSPTI